MRQVSECLGEKRNCDQKSLLSLCLKQFEKCVTTFWFKKSCNWRFLGCSCLFLWASYPTKSSWETYSTVNFGKSFFLTQWISVVISRFFQPRDTFGVIMIVSRMIITGIYGNWSRSLTPLSQKYGFKSLFYLLSRQYLEICRYILSSEGKGQLISECLFDNFWFDNLHIIWQIHYSVPLSYDLATF